MNYLWIAFGSALGGMARYGAQGFFARYVSATFPWGTLFVNVTGCCFIGLFAALTAPEGRLMAPVSVRQFVMIGICGGYTTFSSFGLETLNLARDHDMGRAAANVALSMVLCLSGVWLGYLLGQSLNRLKGI
jgi:CrcB protein